MPVVPITAAKGASLDPQGMPGDTDTAIAAALLHREGHFDQNNTLGTTLPPMKKPPRGK